MTDSNLQEQLTGCRIVIAALAAAMVEPQPPTREQMRDRLTLLEAFTATTESPAAAHSVRHIRAVFTALTSQDIAPDIALIGSIAMHAAAVEECREALHTWLQIATPEELGADVFRSLQSVAGKRGDADKLD